MKTLRSLRPRCCAYSWNEQLSGRALLTPNFRSRCCAPQGSTNKSPLTLVEVGTHGNIALPTTVYRSLTLYNICIHMLCYGIFYCRRSVGCPGWVHRKRPRRMLQPRPILLSFSSLPSIAATWRAAASCAVQPRSSTIAVGAEVQDPCDPSCLLLQLDRIKLTASSFA